jgi:DNA-binding NarL/FixJ family response regulator
MKIYRILVVDDFAPWRDRLRSLLTVRPEWSIIGEACDGHEAIQKASEMQPDIILLDVGMSPLNGIEAAKIIHHRCPKSKILFVTQEHDDDVRNAAMRTGAAGYVLKINAIHELANIISAVLDHY